MHKIIFLDVDGVLNCEQTWKTHWKDGTNTLDPALCDELARIVHATGATVVLSSTWRLFPDIGLWKLNSWLNERGVSIHSHTPSLRNTRGSIRGEEIDLWLSDHASEFPNPRFVILDDDSDMTDDQKPFFVQTSMKTGLLPGLADAAIAILNL